MTSARLVLLAILNLSGVLGASPHAHADASQHRAALSVVPIDPHTLVIYRQREGSDGVEGFVVDQTVLVDTLQNRVLEQRGLGRLARVFTPPQAGQRSLGSFEASRGESYGFEAAYSFEHTFAAPFGSVRASLGLAPLEGESGAGLLYGLTGLLAVAVVLGLYALYRMVAVQVLFAQRRANFVSAVSHELKTPLTAVRMYGEMLRDGMVEDALQRQTYYETITLESERLSRLINNVLELSQLERNTRQVNLSVGDVSQVVGDAVATLRPHAEREGFRLEVHTAPNLPAARFDRDALTQIVFNLLDNALKYGSDGSERRVTVRCEASEEGGVRIAVADRGPGVPADQLAAIFDPFYRAENELTRKKQGTGIGLALVRGLVERMRGRVHGRNLTPGFEVRVELPRV